MKINDFRVALFLVIRYIRGASNLTILLISFVMFLTFLNLTVITGILEGIVVGSLEGTREKAIGDVIITPKDGRSFIDRTQRLVPILEQDKRVKAFSTRYSLGVEIIAQNDLHNISNNSKQRKTITTNAIGVNPRLERETTNLDKSIIEGSYFSEHNNRNEILIGSALVKKYSPFGEDVFDTVTPGDFVNVRLRNDSVLKKYKVAGIFRTKAGELDIAVILVDTEVKLALNNPGNNASTIAIRLVDSDLGPSFRDYLKYSLNFDDFARIETIEEAIGQFLDDIRSIFKTLGSIVGAIGLIVASITIFIVIFVITASRQRFIGIAKGIGISPVSIKISYVLFSLFFAVIGTTLGSLVLFFVLVPFFEANPIPFPFSDGILFVELNSLYIKIGLLFFATFIAGLIPAHRTVKKRTIDAIMNR